MAALALEGLRAGDVVLTLGAGNIWEAGEEILKELKRPGFSFKSRSPGMRGSGPKSPEKKSPGQEAAPAKEDGPDMGRQAGQPGKKPQAKPRPEFPWPVQDRAFWEEAALELSQVANWSARELSLAPLAPLSKLSSLGIGGPAGLLCRAQTYLDLRAVLTAASERRMPVLALGGGTNCLFSDEGLAGLAVKLEGDFEEWLELEGISFIRAGAGAPLHKVLELARDRSLTGLEDLSGIPGTLGGAVRGNAGSGKGGGIGALVSGLKLMDGQGRIVNLARDDLAFSYRRLDLPPAYREAFIIEVALGPLDRGEAGAIKERMLEREKERRDRLPRGKSAGCVFKNPPGREPAGRLLDLCGLKGARVGEAIVSSKHANFVVNRGRATAEEARSLIRTMRRRVEEKFGLRLALEIRIVGPEGRAIGDGDEI
jgi:UDP-N-acetylmuramate dehydrogenase